MCLFISPLEQVGQIDYQRIKQLPRDNPAKGSKENQLILYITNNMVVVVVVPIVLAILYIHS